jgi:hypothetical protein
MAGVRVLDGGVNGEKIPPSKYIDKILYPYTLRWT